MNNIFQQADESLLLNSKHMKQKASGVFFRNGVRRRHIGQIVALVPIIYDFSDSVKSFLKKL